MIIKNFGNKTNLEVEVSINICLDNLNPEIEICCPYCDNPLFKVGDNIFKWPLNYGYIYARITLANYNNKNRTIRCINCDKYTTLEVGSWAG